MRNRHTNLIDDRLFRVKILSSSGDNINLKFPVEFVKRMVKINGLKWLNLKTDVLDTDNLSKTVMQALDYNLTGNIVDVKTKNNDLIKISIE
ncbi:hypothetical protein GCM10008904_28170 [Paraclostridium ghonii]|uniref:Uncharacterized protein n=1 Tax=Paraclostridium ghonii TaxID=29358 RepID=A0ABU0N3I1_9FIRM|nr:hypothetical protein [Paeniclostridium ghonii]MDQ0557696.1 hypothetical protein [Paeniclostridium ghonii]